MQRARGLQIVLLLLSEVLANAQDPQNKSGKIPIEIKNFAAIGDSYAAGTAAGNLLDQKCGRYDSSYPALLNRTTLLPDNHQMQFLACSGTVMKNIWGDGRVSAKSKHPEIREQIDVIKDADFVTVSIGANDVGFFDMLDACVYKFNGNHSANCDEVLLRARGRVEGVEFSDTYNQVLDTILEKRNAPSFKVFVTGYSTFFDDEMSPAYDSKTSLNVHGDRELLLTVDRRSKINQVARALNDRIGDIVKERKDPNVIMVDWAPKFDGHRLCRTKESVEIGNDISAPGDFFQSSFDPPTYVGSDLLSQIDTGTCEDNAAGNWGLRALCATAIASDKKPNSLDQGDVNGAGKFFHPNSAGHTAIVDTIREVWPFTPGRAKLEPRRGGRGGRGGGGGRSTPSKPYYGHDEEQPPPPKPTTQNAVCTLNLLQVLNGNGAYFTEAKLFRKEDGKEEEEIGQKLDVQITPENPLDLASRLPFKVLVNLDDSLLNFRYSTQMWKERSWGIPGCTDFRTWGIVGKRTLKCSFHCE